MTSNGKPDRFQFRLVTLMWVVTTICLLFGFLEWLLPEDSIESRLITYAMLGAAIPYGVWTIHRAQRQMQVPPTDYVLVKVDAKWLRRVKSPFIFFPIGALTGVSLTFAPFYLFWCGQWQQLGILEWIIVALCFLMIYFIPSFYMSLASEVMAELVKIDRQQSDTTRI